jgi:hypothetical protein
MLVRYVVRGTVTSWNDYRSRRSLFLAILLGAIPAAAVIGIPLNRLLDSDVPFLVVAIGSVVLFLYAGLRLYGFRCPSCGKPFFRRGLSYNLFARRCMHCGFPKEQIRGHPE